MSKATIEQLDPQGYWRAFARKFPEASKAINAKAREIDAHNLRVARTCSHAVAGMRTRFNYASVMRTNIASGYTPEDVQRRIGREWTPKAS